MTEMLLYGQPPVVGTNETPLCVRLAKAVTSGNIHDLESPLRTIQLEFEPDSAEYTCPLAESCASATALNGGKLVLGSTVSYSLKPKEEAYQLPPEADLILKCPELTRAQ